MTFCDHPVSYGPRVWFDFNWLGFGFGRGGGVLIGWHCAKVQGHAELEIVKPRVKTLSYDFPKLQHSKTNTATVFVLTSIYAKVFEKR